MKKASLLLAILVILIPLTLCLPVSADSQFAGGACGISTTWTYEITSKTLTISGSGEMEGTPAASYTDQIEKIVLEDGISNVSASAFAGCVNLKQVELPGSVTVIGAGAFSGCSSLTEIRIPGGVTEIGSSAFSGCSALTKITFCGTQSQWNAVNKGSSWASGTGNYTVSYHTEHTWGNETVIKQPTCVDGTKSYTCTVCGEMKTEHVSPVSDHTYGIEESYNKTHHKKTCICGHVQYEEHIFDSNADESCNACSFLKHDDPKDPNLKHTSPFDHTYNAREPYNEQYHKKICDCGYSQAESHDYSADDDANCDLCGYNKNGENGDIVINNGKASKSGCKSAITSGAGLLLLLSLGASAIVRKKDK